MIFKHIKNTFKTHQRKHKQCIQMTSTKTHTPTQAKPYSSTNTSYVLPLGGPRQEQNWPCKTDEFISVVNVCCWHPICDSIYVFAILVATPLPPSKTTRRCASPLHQYVRMSVGECDQHGQCTAPTHRVATRHHQVKNTKKSLKQHRAWKKHKTWMKNAQEKH